MPHLGLTALVVREYDEAIAFYTGAAVVFQDLYGNRWDLIEPHK